MEMGPYRTKEAWKREYDKQRQKILREIEKAKTPTIRKDKEDLLKRHDRTELFERRQVFRNSGTLDPSLEGEHRWGGRGTQVRCAQNWGQNER